LRMVPVGAVCTIGSSLGSPGTCLGTKGGSSTSFATRWTARRARATNRRLRPRSSTSVRWSSSRRYAETKNRTRLRRAVSIS
jgi:hypothetical protein